jgi:hypothetical protein
VFLSNPIGNVGSDLGFDCLFARLFLEALCLVDVILLDLSVVRMLLITKPDARLAPGSTSQVYKQLVYSLSVEPYYCSKHSACNASLNATALARSILLR